MKKKKIVLGIVLLFVVVNFGISFYAPKAERAGTYVEVDFGRMSGVPRFFVFDGGECVSKSLCAHGKGKGNTFWRPKFSNEIGSGCSSLGRFRITGRTVMTNGYPALVLKGLDATNSNAEERRIYVHHSQLVDVCQFGIFPFYLPLTNASNGCFAISSQCYNVLDSLFRAKKDIVIEARD